MNTIGLSYDSTPDKFSSRFHNRTSKIKSLLETIASSFWGRYGLALGSFVILLGISLSLSYLGIKISLTIVILVGLVIAAWYGGLGPGILMAVLIVGATILSQPKAPDLSLAKYAFAHFSNFALIVFIVALIHSRRVAETKLQHQSDELQDLNATLERRVSKRTAELEVANHELESFSYSVSHDLRAPLRAIDSFSHALLEDHEHRLNDEAKSFLKNIRGATSNMGQLIDDLLQLAKVTKGQLNRTEIDLSKMAREIISELRHRDPNRSVDCEIEDHVIASADEKLIRLALQNLIDNSWKFTSARQDAQIWFGKIDTDGVTEFYVRDNGAGFDMQFADRLFRPFERLHSTEEFDGTGIGLATVERVIQKHGGVVRGESGTGGGACFYFTL